MHNLSCLRRPNRGRPAVICLLIVIVQMLHFGAANEADDMNGAPEILENQPDFELEVDSMMELSCQGREPVKWIIKRTPDEDIEPEEDVLLVEEYKTNVADKPFGSRVTILKASPEIVGRYYCLYQSAEDTVEDIADLLPQYKADSTYIFVKDQQLVPVLNTVVHGVQYSEVIIPCKPSSKDGVVELVKDEHEMLVNHGGFSNMRGFTILAKSLEQSGLYLCRSLNNTEQPIHFELSVNEACELSTLLDEDPFTANGTTSSTSSTNNNNYTSVGNPCRVVESSSPLSTTFDVPMPPDVDDLSGEFAEVFNETNDERFLEKLTNLQDSNETTDQPDVDPTTPLRSSTVGGNGTDKSPVKADIATTTITTTKLASTSSGVGSKKLAVSARVLPHRGGFGSAPTQDPSASPQLRPRNTCNYFYLSLTFSTIVDFMLPV